MTVLLLVLGGCSSTGRVGQQLAQQLRLDNYPAALELVENERTRAFAGKNRLLYYLEKGMLLHSSGRFAESNEAFEQAKRIGNDLYTKSLSGAGISLMTNDYALAYAGENFERTLIHLFSSLNYIQLDDLDSALVEVRQVGEYLRKLQVDSAGGNAYQEDAFARYLSALLYEVGGEPDAALVDYKKATQAYVDYQSKFAVATPQSLPPHAARIAARLGSWATRDLRKQGIDAPPREIPKGSGELILLHYNGLAPIKDQDKFVIPFSEAWVMVAAFQAAADPSTRNQINQATTIASTIRNVDVVSVAFPKYVDRPYTIKRMKPRVGSASGVLGPTLVEDIGAIAKKDLADRIARIRTKAIARAAIKYAIQKAAQVAAKEAGGGDYGQLLSAGTQVLGNIGRFATEQADKRVWSTLPDEIWMTSMILPAGEHAVDVDFVTAQNVLVESRSLGPVEVPAGGRRFVVVRTVR